MLQSLKLKNIIHLFACFSYSRVQNFGFYFVPFGIFGIINYPISYLYFIFSNSHNQESLTLRIICTILCLALIFYKKYPKSIQKYIPLYWHFTLTMCIPVIGVYLLMKNNFSEEWLNNITLGLLLLIIIVDWLSFIIIELIGIIIGCLLYILFNGTDNLIISSDKETIINSIYTYILTIVIGTVFANRRDKYNSEKLSVLKALGGKIAHEMRTPLASIALLNDKINNECNLDSENKSLNKISKISELISKCASNANFVIDTLLFKVTEKKNIYNITSFTAIELINESVSTYPLDSEDSSLIKINCLKEIDFTINADKDLLKHVLYNLIKNSIFYIKKHDKGNIYISLYSDNKNNYISFKDTAIGVEKNNLSKLFEKFYTDNSNGTGLGLYFSKEVMIELGGDIEVHSVFGEHITFLLKFPKNLEK